MGRKAINLVGQKFGKLLVLEKDLETTQSHGNKQIYWKCRCDCGTIKSVQGSSLRSEHTRSCGCLQKEVASKNTLKDLTGQCFGYLTVLKRDESKPKGHQKKAYWICQCECGKQISVISDSLLSRHTNSCGCKNFSRGENKIKEILREEEINYKAQFTFSDLQNHNTPLRFDFAIFENNKIKCLIEYQGQQHYERVPFLQSEEKYQTQITNDILKRQYCKQNNLKLIEISYKDFNKIDTNYVKERIYNDI